jgi:hypothetical protein
MRRIIPLIAVSICLSSVSDGRATHLANSASSCREKSENRCPYKIDLVWYWHGAWKEWYLASGHSERMSAA